MNILVTGYKGFIGSYLVSKLKRDGHQLQLLDIADGIDICNWDEIKDYHGFNLVIHLANLVFVPASYSQPREFYTVNYLSTLNMLELCRMRNANMIYFSSYMYGHPKYQPIDENHPLEAYNPYAQTKLICEELCEGYHRDFKVPITIFRPFNIYGRGQNPDFLIPTIISQAETGKITVKDDRPKRDYIHVQDVIEAVNTAIKKDNQQNLEIYNVGSGKSYSVKEIVNLVQELSEKDVEYHCTNEIRPNEVLDTIADISKIKKELGWTPNISLKEGLKSMMNNSLD